LSKLLKEKLKNLNATLLKTYSDTVGYTSPVLGAEREVVTKQLLNFILSPGYRVGSGAIIDEKGRETGHVDAIIEQPFSLSFPISSDTNRLYLAGAVGAAFEIKSDLYTQEKEALNKVEEIKALHRYSPDKDEIVEFGTLLIPTFIISFKGPKKIKTLEDNFLKPSNQNPNGVFIIESGLFCGRASDGTWYKGKGEAESMLAFIACVNRSLEYIESESTDLRGYIDLLSSKT
tara:strand:+ start:1299 stop:1994 length:696 start_codon:yes stop_codon:yes gene_type:complete